MRIAICRHEHGGDIAALDLLMFRQWQSQLSPPMLAIPGVAAGLLNVAVVMRDMLNLESLHKSRAAWLSWLKEGPARGLSRQHKMSRMALGWVPSATGPSDWQTVDEAATEMDPDTVNVVEAAVHSEPLAAASRIVVSGSVRPACPVSP